MDNLTSKRALLVSRVALSLIFLAALAPVHVSGQTWLSGTWEGTGYQIDADEKWTMLLRVRGNKFVIEYPSLKCSGVWRLLDFDSRSARFKEKITVGVSDCANNGTVTIERLNRKQIAFRYASDTREISASAILNRKK